MPQLIAKHNLTDVPPHRMMELRDAMCQQLGLEMLNLFLDDPDYETGATVRVEKDIIFEGETETEMGIPHLKITVHLNNSGEAYLKDKTPVKELIA